MASLSMATRGSSRGADFWDFLPPIFVKELRQGLRANQFVWPFIVVQIVAIACISLEYASNNLLESYGFGSWDGISKIFYVLLWAVFSVILPLTLFNSLQPEVRGGRNIELLLLSNLTRWQIVLGKWVVGSVLSSLMLVSLIPYWLVRYLVGSFDSLGVELLNIIYVFTSNMVCNAIVVGVSGIKNIVGRFVLIIFSAICGWLTGLATVAGLVGKSMDPFTIVMILLSSFLMVALVVALNLQLGRAKLRLFEDPLDPPGTALIIVLIICSPIMIGIVTGFTGSFGWVMTLALLILTLMIDPGPGRKNRKWPQA